MSTGAAVAAGTTEIDETDLRRVRRMTGIVRDDLIGPEGLRFDHAGLMLFPRSVDGALSLLEGEGLPVVRKLRSVVVRDRLVRRYGLVDPDIVIAHLDAGEGRTVELFLLEDCPWRVAADERARERETHLAYEARPGDLKVLTSLREQGLIPDGGGFNADEGPTGRTVFYFRDPQGGDRLEIVIAGHQEDDLARHVDNGDERRRMLGLLTGAWTTQALHAAASLGIADRLYGRVLGLDVLAEETACPADRLARLVRYLEQLGVVHRVGELIGLTPLGATLASESPQSLHGVALLYGGLFFRSFGRLPETIRSGVSGFELAHGIAPFAHLDGNPADAAVFQRAMADQCRDVFDSVVTSLDLTGVGTVTDLGGGTGVLLGRILDHAPQITGVLFDTPATVETVRSDLGARFGPRISLIGGDLFTEVPGGDLVILSRILHDWDDAACAGLLACCRRAMEPGARLAVIERVLPDQPEQRSLAAAWDVHMMVNNVGGRERTLPEYRDMLGAAGFTFVSRVELPLDVHLIEAVAD
ncbi:hypothetical protein J5X84_30845 [Streptosporangiaceae bacterium NEAU-GS5]|nr:hypothetical protein [Streptosporangiaceae bacterium NEAU-GS5]